MRNAAALRRVLRVQGMKNMIMRFVLDELGATAVEYGLIAAGISVAIVTVLLYG